MSLLTTAALQILFEQTLSPEVSTRREAERFILQHERIPGHAMVILSFILDNRHRDSGIGQAAAIYFKHLVKKEWSRRIIFSHEDRVTIKGSLVELMCTLPPAIQSEIGECIAIIASSDFPTRWSSVLPALTSQLRDTNASNLDWDGINGVLLAADFIFRRWFDDRKLIYLRRDHLQLFLEALTKLFLDFVAKLQALALEKGVTISSCLRAIRSTCSIFHSVICEVGKLFRLG
jgi:exportin-2 (importin alpha re-exporter)